MPSNTLSDSKCKAAKPKEKSFKLYDGGGLFLFCSPAGGKIWRYGYRKDGKQQTATIGPYPLVSLLDARTKRDAMRLQLLAGVVVSAKPKKSKALTLSAAIEKYWQGRKDVSASYLQNATRALAKYIEPNLGSKPIDQVTRDDVLTTLLAMDAAGLHVYVRKTRMWLGQVFDWAVENAQAKQNPCALINPEKAFGHAPVVSFAALSLTEIKPFMERLELEGVLQSAIACKLLALTWVRTQELRLMEWTEIEGDVWRIPAGKMKRRREHIVPLSTQALALIDHMRLRAQGRYVFPNDRQPLDKAMSENAILYLIGRMGYGGRMTGHAWRSVGSTWAHENGYASEAIEIQLAHAPENKVASVYNRAQYIDLRRKMLQSFADWLLN